jgi:hypothetical protein
MSPTAFSVGYRLLPISWRGRCLRRPGQSPVAGRPLGGLYGAQDRVCAYNILELMRNVAPHDLGETPC